MLGMKYIVRLLLPTIFCTVLLATACLAQAQAGFSVGSFNVHYISERRPKLPWEERRDAVSAAINELDADIIGFQEMETWMGRGVHGDNIQLEWVLLHSQQYSAAAVGDPETYPWTQPILYRPEKFESLQQGFFYFSDTPDQIYSRPWDQSFASFASWVQFLDLATNKTFRIVNVHFDHSSKVNRHGAARLVSERINPWLEASEPVVVLGDFNALSWFKTIDILEKSGLTLADGNASTFHFNKGLSLFPAIDHVLFSGFEQQGDTQTLDKKYDGVWPSDHYPIRVDLRPHFSEKQTAKNSGALSDKECQNQNTGTEKYC